MPRRNDELDESPQESDVEAFGDATVTCPHCRATLYDDVELCWKCGHALGAGPAHGRAWIAWVAAGLLALFVLALLTRGLW
ncbi:MAG: hypothetical protein HBSAPP03_08860 [Phycisphaerae bacterium]|nr:MAG: hypothetical protein HBSAPP03_08860 [Phycisphaerae bacterium]